MRLENERTLFRLAISSLSSTRIDEVFAGDMRLGESDCDEAGAAAGGASKAWSGEVPGAAVRRGRLGLTEPEPEPGTLGSG